MNEKLQFFLLITFLPKEGLTKKFGSTGLNIAHLDVLVLLRSVVSCANGSDRNVAMQLSAVPEEER